MSQYALSTNPLFRPTQVLNQLRSGQVFYVKARRGNGMIICHPHFAEVVGPGAIVGGVVDLDCARLIPIGRAALTYPETFERKYRAFHVRRQWIEATQKAVDCEVPLKRARRIVVMMRQYFGRRAIAEIPDEVLGNLVGVFPQTIELARHSLRQRPGAIAPPPHPSPQTLVRN
ncbi:hypothetical protein PN441_20105 [Spirulina major CS-329]|uniref:hypothetical protein n=1 Tax=Spirulina TaxID=1154 RepID=UPI00233001CE|nr:MULTISPECIES: hypothetical protein [Spirulina]MDB9493807.1 hypothetical protein [Spirulina subsalsa CS-330]MDB9505389.1 hypothetical protein [Spirulina major CS-329]